MRGESVRNYFLVALLAAVLIATFYILRPFVGVLALAVVFAVVFYPVHRKIFQLFGKRDSLAALISTILVIMVIFVPIFAVGYRVLDEAGQLYSSFTSGGGWSSLVAFLYAKIGIIHAFLPGIEQLTLDINVYLQQVLAYVIDHLGAAFSNIARLIVSGIVFLVAFFYFLRDGKKMLEAFIRLSPLSDELDQGIMAKLERAINSVFRGNIVVALIQGIICTGGLMLFGVPNPVLWGLVATLAALIPGIGTTVVLVPAIIYLYFTSSIQMTIGLLLWGTLAVGLIDNYLGPKLIGKHANLHPLFVMLSVLGGIILFGPLGVVLGPLTISLLFALLDVLNSLTRVSAAPSSISVPETARQQKQ